jgi:hypothetical protein
MNAGSPVSEFATAGTNSAERVPGFSSEGSNNSMEKEFSTLTDRFGTAFPISSPVEQHCRLEIATKSS